MEKSHKHTHGCTHCSCNNPVLEILKEEIFSAENLMKMNPGSGKRPHQNLQPLMISGGVIRPMIGGLRNQVNPLEYLMERLL